MIIYEQKIVISKHTTFKLLLIWALKGVNSYFLAFRRDDSVSICLKSVCDHFCAFTNSLKGIYYFYPQLWSVLYI